MPRSSPPPYDEGDGTDDGVEEIEAPEDRIPYDERDEWDEPTWDTREEMWGLK